MALQFLSDADVGDAELVINLDLEGLHTLLKALTAAVEARIEQTTLAGGDASEVPAASATNAFGRVTLRYVDAPGDAPAEARPN